MSLTKQHFESLALTCALISCKGRLDERQRDVLVETIALFCSDWNDRFNESRFLAAYHNYFDTLNIKLTPKGERINK